MSANNSEYFSRRHDSVQQSYQVPEGNIYDTWEVRLDELIILSIFKPYETENISLLKSKS